MTLVRPNRVFFPQALLDAWIADERVELHGTELLLRDEGRRYAISEAFHVFRDATGTSKSDLLGTVKTKEQLDQIGAEVFEASMILGDDAFDVVPGFVGEPVGVAEPKRPNTDGTEPEEDLLVQFLINKL